MPGNQNRKQSQQALPGAADQVYATHCSQTDSYGHKQGFGVRASSTDDPDLVKFADNFPGYDLPTDMEASQPTPEEAPVRLAKARLPDGRVALVHTALAKADSRGRPNSYFSHILFYESLGLAEALKTWGASVWQTTYTTGSPTSLVNFTGFPADKVLIDDSALTDFLNGHDDSGPLSVTVFPRGRVTRKEERRRWVRALILATLQLQHDSSGDRSRIFVLAEPGVTALLLYAVARLLPTEATNALTFSTFESFQPSTLSGFQIAQIIGTYVQDHRQKLDSDFLSRLGYGIDTYHDRISQDIDDIQGAAVDGLLKLAEDGDWKSVDILHELWNHPKSALAREPIAVALELGPLYLAIQDGTATIEQIERLWSIDFGRVLVEEQHARVWRKLFDACLEDSRKKEEFRGILRLHTEEMGAIVLEALRSHGAEDWSAVWRLTKCFLAEEQWAPVFATLIHRAHGEEFDLREDRLGLVAELIALPHGEVPGEDERWLLVGGSPQQASSLLELNLPDHWKFAVLTAALSDAAQHEVCEEHLCNLEPAQLSRFFESLAGESSTDEQMVELLGPTFRLQSDRTRSLAKALIRSDIPERVVDRLLVEAGAADEAWIPLWCSDDLIRRVCRLGSDSEFAGKFWEKACARLRADYFMEKPQTQAIRKAVDSLSSEDIQMLPSSVSAAVEAHRRIFQHFREPSKKYDESLVALCESVQTKPGELLSKYWALLQKRNDGGHPSRDQIERFQQSARGFFDNYKKLINQLYLIAYHPPIRPDDYPRWVEFYELLFQVVVPDERRADVFEWFDDQLIQQTARNVYVPEVVRTQLRSILYPPPEPEVEDFQPQKRIIRPGQAADSRTGGRLEFVKDFLRKFFTQRVLFVSIVAGAYVFGVVTGYILGLYHAPPSNQSPGSSQQETVAPSTEVDPAPESGSSPSSPASGPAPNHASRIDPASLRTSPGARIGSPSFMRTNLLASRRS